MYIRRFEDADEQNMDTLLGSLNLGIKNKWLIGKNPSGNVGKLSFALKHITIEPGKLHPMRPCEYNEAAIVLDGKGIIRHKNEEVEIRQGDVVVIRSGEMYSLKNSGETDLKTLCCIDLQS